MSNEWNSLSESYKSARTKNIASVKLKKKSIIYKHVVIKKQQRLDESPAKEIEVKNEFPILSKYHQNPRSSSFSHPKNCEKYLTWLHTNLPRRGELSNLRETSLEVNNLTGRPDLNSYLINSRLSLGKRVMENENKMILKNIVQDNLSISISDVELKYFFNPTQKEFYVVVFGDMAPLSQCCGVHYIVQVSNEFGGKVVCPHRKCVIKCISNFLIEKNDRFALWPQHESEKQENVQQKFSQNEINKSNKNTVQSSFMNSSMLNIPNSNRHPFVGPLQQLLKFHKKLSY